tara:strand:- start:960 stop:1235 length:276 start_codon:yes stop_codon:yes gene_type:complete
MENTNRKHSISRPTHAGGRTNEFEEEAPPTPAGPSQRLDHGGEAVTWFVVDNRTGNETRCHSELDAAFLCKQLWDLFPDDGGNFAYYGSDE